MNNYSDEHFNKQNVNNVNEGATDLDIRDRSITYMLNGMDRRQRPHGYQLSLACQSGNDMIHTVGNVTAVVLQFILDQFPDGTFATAMPSTKIAHRQLKHTPKQIRTQPYPICVVNPRISLSGLDNRLAAGSYATTNWSPTSNRFQNRSEMELLLFDSRNGIEWRGKINRTVVLFDFVLSFKSIVEQINWASYLINTLPTDGASFDIETALEMAIPDGFIGETSRYAKIPIKDEKGNVSRFVDYLNMNSVFPISYRFSSGRHKDAFYSYYMTPLLCTISDLNYNSVNRVGNVESDCTITFTLRCEFNTIGRFDLSVPNPGPFRIIKPENTTVAIPIFSDIFNKEAYEAKLPYGWKLHSRPIVKLDWGETEVDLGKIFGSELSEVLDYHLEHHIKPELFISIKLRENRCLIEDGYYIDWKNRKLVLTNINYAQTYRLVVSVNKLYIQNILTELYGKTQIF